jgi:4-hydroxybenzoate polyprenyltransferase
MHKKNKQTIMNHLPVSSDEKLLPLPARMWRYLKERFPLHQHGPLIIAFAFSAASYSRVCRGEPGLIHPLQFAVGSATAVMFFMLLRIADEFKDFTDDSLFRPYRAVPRGLVSLTELGCFAALIIMLQLTLNYLFMPRMLIPLLIGLFYLFLMSREFFVPIWLKRHPMTYMLSHMLIMPVIDLYTTGLDWLNAGANPPSSLVYFLIISFSNGIVIEVGRKIRARDAEEKGVETYSSLYGEAVATVSWLAVVWVTFALAAAASIKSGAGKTGIPLLACCLVICSVPAIRFLSNRTQKMAHKIETAAGIWTIGMYLILGATPVIVLWLNSLLK